MHIAIVRIVENAVKRDININNEHAMIIIARASIAMSQPTLVLWPIIFTIYMLQVTGIARE